MCNKKIEKYLTTACIFALAVSALVNAKCIAVTAKTCNEMSAQVLELEKQVIALQKEVEEQKNMIIVEQEKEETEAPKREVNYNYDYILRVVAAECRGESLEGQMAVAQVIRQRAEDSGMTPEEVVKQKYQFASPVSMDLVNDSVREACERVLINGESVTDKPIKHFYSTKNGFVSAGHEKKTYVMTIGYHKFFMD